MTKRKKENFGKELKKRGKKKEARRTRRASFFVYFMVEFPHLRRWWSGLSQQTVNLSASAFVGSNPTRRTKEKYPLGYFLMSGWI